MLQDDAAERHAARRRRMPVFYDGGCGICVPIVNALRRLDIFHRLEFIDIVRQWPRVQQAAPALTRDSAFTEMHGVAANGRLVAGFDTYREIAWLTPFGWPFLPLMYVPPIASLGRRAFRRIADRRHRAGCALPPK